MFKRIKAKQLLLTLGLVLATAGISYAAFSDVGKLTGSKFSFGSADIKLFLNVAGGIDDINLVDELPGPNFENIVPNWTQDYLIKLYNNGSGNISLASFSDYLTVNDPDDLRYDLSVEIFEWNDINTNGTAEIDEIGATLGNKTFVKWKTEGFSLGSISSGQIKGV